MKPRPVPLVLGLSGPQLTSVERELFRRHLPLGFILFRRNCREPWQLQRLVEDLHDLGDAFRASVWIDQEGGRVQRLRPPVWPALPAAREIGRCHERDPRRGREAAGLLADVLAALLKEGKIDVNCAPVLDLAYPETTEAIGDRSFGASPQMVGELGGIFIRRLREGGVAPVIKHLPGHGRARVDSHRELPHVDASLEELAATDFVPFRLCREAPFAMTAHVRYEAIDPDRPATLSRRVISGVIREMIGFRGILVSDDLAMGALAGDPLARARGALDAGCDLALHCTGREEDARQLVEGLPTARDELLERLASALAVAGMEESGVVEDRLHRLRALLDGAHA